jgi:ATP-dependent Clp protease protease subunit
MAAKPKTPKKASGRSLMERHALRSRSVLLFGGIEPVLTREVVRQILVLDQISSTKPITVYVNSPGGLADDGFAIYDVMRFVKAPVTTIVTGLAASAATIVMVGAPKDRRFVLPHSRIMLHQPSVGIRGTAADIAISAKEIIRLRLKANELFVRETGKPLDVIEKDMHRDFWMSAQEAVDYGLLTKVVTSATDLPK